MGNISMVGEPLKNLPWQARPRGCHDVVWRHTGNPITQWNPVPKAARVFNSAVVPFRGAFAGVFRADHCNTGALLHAGRSRDGLKWTIEPEPIRWKDEDGRPFEPGYAYDPRVVRIGDVHYITWCTHFGGPAIGFGMTRDFKEFTRLENLTIPFNRNGVLFPRKVNGRYLLLNRPSDDGHTPFGDIYISESPDLVYWGRHRRVMTRSGSSWWQGLKIGPGPIPIETSEGWLLFYHGVCRTCSGYVYSMGAALLDLERPAKVLYRARGYLLTPEKDYETVGFVPNVVFPCATLQDAPSGRIAIYYGSADTYVAVAYTQLDELVAHIKSDSELLPGDAEDFR